MEIKTLKGVSKTDILNVFNTSFSDYFIPFKLSEEQLASKLLVDKTDLELSVGVFENGHLIAFILHGIDTFHNQKTVYNGGTGVIPEKRGAGLTKQMYRFILPFLTEKGIHKIILEVISNNVQAIRSYEKSGFKVHRKLVCYNGDISTHKINNGIEISVLLEYDWAVMESFWDMNPTWQNAISALNELQQNNISLGAYIENQLIGYVICNPSNNRIQQIAVSKDFRQKGIASSLCNALTHNNGSKFSIINVDENSRSIHAFLNNIGFEMTLEQLEMELVLT